MEHPGKRPERCSVKEGVKVTWCSGWLGLGVCVSASVLLLAVWAALALAGVVFLVVVSCRLALSVWALSPGLSFPCFFEGATTQGLIGKGGIP